MLVFQMGGPGPLASKGRDEEEMRHLIDQAVQAVHEKALMLSAQPGSQNAPSAASQVIFPLGKMEELAAYGPTPAAVWKSIAARIHDLDLGIGLKYEKDTSTFYLTKTVAPLSQPSGKEVLLTKIPPEIKVIDLSTGLIAAEMAAGIAPAQIANDLLYAITSSVSPGSQEMAELGGIYSQIEEDLVKGVFKDYRIVRDDAGHFALAQSAQEESAQAKAGVAPLPAVPAPEAAEEGGQIRKPKARKPSARLVSKEEGEFSALGTEIAGLPNTWSDAKQDRYFQWREKQMALQAAQASIVSESEPVSKNAAQTAVAGTAPVAEQAPVIAPAPSAASESQQLAQIQEVWGTGITAALAKTVIQSGAISDFNRLHALAAGSDPRAAFLKARRDFEAMLEKKDSGGQSVFEQNLGSYISLNRAFPGQIGVNDVSYHLGNGGGESTVEGMLLAAKLNPGIKAADAWKLVEPYISQTLEERGKRLQSMAQFYEDAGLSKLPGATLADVSALYAKCETYQTWPNFAELEKKLASQVKTGIQAGLNAAQLGDMFTLADNAGYGLGAANTRLDSRPPKNADEARQLQADAQATAERIRQTVAGPAPAIPSASALVLAGGYHQALMGKDPAVQNFYGWLAKNDGRVTQQVNAELKRFRDEIDGNQKSILAAATAVLNDARLTDDPKASSVRLQDEIVRNLEKSLSGFSPQMLKDPRALDSVIGVTIGRLYIDDQLGLKAKANAVPLVFDRINPVAAYYPPNSTYPGLSTTEYSRSSKAMIRLGTFQESFSHYTTAYLSDQAFLFDQINTGMHEETHSLPYRNGENGTANELAVALVLSRFSLPVKTEELQDREVFAMPLSSVWGLDGQEFAGRMKAELEAHGLGRGIPQAQWTQVQVDFDRRADLALGEFSIRDYTGSLYYGQVEGDRYSIRRSVKDLPAGKDDFAKYFSSGPGGSVQFIRPMVRDTSVYFAAVLAPWIEKTISRPADALQYRTSGETAAASGGAGAHMGMTLSEALLMAQQNPAGLDRYLLDGEGLRDQALRQNVMGAMRATAGDMSAYDRASHRLDESRDKAQIESLIRNLSKFLGSPAPSTLPPEWSSLPSPDRVPSMA